jgi:hypothetical protein
MLTHTIEKMSRLTRKSLSERIWDDAENLSSSIMAKELECFIASHNENSQNPHIANELLRLL